MEEYDEEMEEKEEKEDDCPMRKGGSRERRNLGDLGMLAEEVRVDFEQELVGGLAKLLSLRRGLGGLRGG